MNRKFFFLLTATVLLSACSLNRIDSDETALEFLPSKDSAKDITYLEKVDRPYTVIGTVSVNTERRWEMPYVIEKIKREAAHIGGDAVTNVQEKPPVIKQKFFKNAYLRTNYTADVIEFTGAAEPAKVEQKAEPAKTEKKADSAKTGKKAVPAKAKKAAKPVKL